jgi:S1-C subfamily serine protease
MTTRAFAAISVSCLTLAGILALPGVTPNSVATGSDAAPVAGETGVVDITSRVGDAVAAGTGIVLAGGEVLTNNHVIQDGTRIRVVTPDGRRYRVRVLGTDATHDVALLKLAGTSDIAPAALGDSSGVVVGQPVRAIGNADGAGGTPAVASGQVTALDQSITATDATGLRPERLSGLIQTDAPIKPGYSGGPLIDAAGHVIGVDTAAWVDPAGQQQQQPPQAFAIPINRAMGVVRAIEAGRGSQDVHIGSAPRLGVALVDDVFPLRGALVTTVEAGSPAKTAGLAPGDLITSVDGRAVKSSAAFTRLLHRHHPGDVLRLRWRETFGLGGSHAATIALVAGPPA